MLARQLPLLYQDRYGRLEAEAIAAARDVDAALWYVPRDLRGVYEQSFGQVPAKVGSPIGLLLDRQYGETQEGHEKNYQDCSSAVTGSPGTLPTGWLDAGGFGLSREILGVTPDYYDIRYSGTTPDGYLEVVLTNTIGTTYPVSEGQSFRVQGQCDIIAGSLPIGSYLQLVHFSEGSGDYISHGLVNGEKKEFQVKIVSGSTSARTTYICVFPTGSSFDVTLRVYPMSSRQVLGYHLTQPTSAAKPQVAINSNQFPAFWCDGIDDTLVADLGAPVTTEVSGVFAARSFVSAGYPQLLEQPVIDGAVLFMLPSGNLLGQNRTSRNEYLVQSAPAPVGNFVGSMVLNTTRREMRWGGDLVASDGGLPNAFVGSTLMRLGFNWTGAIGLACACPATMPNANRIAIERFAAHIVGAPYAY